MLDLLLDLLLDSFIFFTLGSLFTQTGFAMSRELQKLRELKYTDINVIYIRIFLCILNFIGIVIIFFRLTQ
jgi:hypothetical protein